ncbi:MAG TPA: secretin N-terminal domain-containing protein, partial [Pirellulaceae bacterium]|nr:secretin N-terminal domain-containing protein [Pirellulaceae bacterium]
MLDSTTVKLAAFVARCLCVCVLAAALASAANAQSSLPAGSRAYQLRHREAAEIAPQLRTMLSGVGDATNVYVDQELNRLIVQGSAQAQQIALQLVGALDQPAAARPNTQPAVVARAYRTADRDPRETAQTLQKQFPDARIEADVRTGQVVALASEATQHQIAAALGDPSAQPAAGAAQQAAPRGYQLQNMTWREFETQLRQMWGERVALSTTQTGEIAMIVLATTTGPRAVMRIDRRTNVVTFDDAGREAHVWEQVARAIDLPRNTDERAQLISLRDADPAQVQRAVALVQATSPLAADDENATATVQLGGGNRARWGGDLAANLFQPGAQPGNEQAPQPAAQPAEPGPAGEAAADTAAEGSGLIGPVQIEFLEGMDAIMIRGHKRDVERVRKIIEDIERLSQETQPLVEVYPLEFVNSQAVTTLVTELYEEILSPRQGQVSIRALVEPNAILLIGRKESIDVVKDLIQKLDRPMAPSSRFEVLRLKHVSAIDAETAIRNFFVERPGQGTDLRTGLGTRVQVIADYRTNTLIVQASPRDLGEVKRLIESIDTEDSGATAEVRVFKLRNSMAEELAEVLQAAIAGDAQQTGQQGQQGQQAGGTSQAGSRLPSPALEFMMLDQAGGRLLRSGVVSDVQVSADTNTNALIVRAPSKSMELIAALIKELDQMPDAEAQLKVFTILNGDATSLAATLQQVFGQDVSIGQGTGGALGIAFRQPQVQSTTTGGENSLVPLTFAVDVRTNSVIASGSESDLEVVETLLLRLDEEGFTTNQVIVYRLKNNDAESVALSIQSYIQAQTTSLNQTVQAGLSTTLDRLILQISVIAEPFSNSVIVAASPRYMDMIMQAIRDLDVRPPMVMVQCLIAEIDISDIHEFGAEFGLQDALLFDRGITTAGDPPSLPGFNFNNVGNLNNNNLKVDMNSGLPNFNTAGSGTLASQAVSALGVGRAATAGGPGGLVLSAASESINILIRALEQEGRAQILSRPQVMALNNQPAFIQVGQDIARFQGSTATNNGVTQNVTDVPTGLILSINPRINDDGIVVMTVDADKSELGTTGGTTLTDGNGFPFTILPINRTTAQTTVSAKSGQTVVIGGLITKKDQLISRGVPYLRDIPWVGQLFNFEATSSTRTELLIVLTPYIVSEDEDYEFIKAIESQRMNWCLGDVISLDGDRGLQGAGCLFCENDVPVLFPDNDPTGAHFAAGEHEHVHEPLQPTPVVLPNEPGAGLQRSSYGEQPNLQPLPQQTINTG